MVTGAIVFSYLYVTTEIPQPEKIAMAEKTTVYYADGTTAIGTFGEQNRQIISCSTLPSYVGQAVVASENRSFYTDNGIDLKGIARAALNNITTGSRQGGSSITQQYAERYYLGETTSYTGKLREAVLALKIARTQDKSTVLCNYLNTIYFGRGAYGIQAASQAYFGKDAKDLTLAQAALLAGIIPAPSSWDPAVNAKQAKARQTRVLGIMVEDGYITATQRKSATMPTTIATRQSNEYSGPNGYLLQMVRDELTSSKDFTKDELDTGGYRIITSIDKTKQDLMFQTASPSKGGKGIVPDGVQVGGISVNPTNGAIIAVYAGDDYLTKPLNNATQALYEPGSTMKPFALLGAVQDGVSLSTAFNGNSPRTYTGISDPVGNYGNVSYGTIDLYHATAYSVNTVYMELQQKLGASAVAKLAVDAGMSSSRITGKNPFTVLGNDGVHLTDIARAYSTIANQGQRGTLHIVDTVKDGTGKTTLYRGPTSTTRVFDSTSTALVTKAMRSVVTYGLGTEVQNVGKTVAGKSGTANDGTAGSFAGFTPDMVTVFAMWNPDSSGNPQIVPAFGRYTAASEYPIHLFTEYMKQALENTPDKAFPTVTDSGTIGGRDGTWGTGYRLSTTPSSGPTSSSQPTASPTQGQSSSPTPSSGQTASTPENSGTDKEPATDGDSGSGDDAGGTGGTKPNSGKTTNGKSTKSESSGDGSAKSGSE